MPIIFKPLMVQFFIFIIVVLFILAISDLVVGVSNDAVNFLNSAFGSKVAPFRVIMIIAVLGVLFGATFSNGMMEVARKGIFNPGEFSFEEIMIIFLAVMLTDIILLDLFNTFGLPTSTTVSIVFELLGSAVAISVVKLARNPEISNTLGTYINSSKALAIIFGILLSVVIAFAVGAVVMYLTRILFSFNYRKYLKYFGAIWGGIAITAITYFIIIKGARGSSFMNDATVNWINNNTIRLLLYNLLGWTIFLQLLQWLFKLNIPKMIVLVGTFSLAMAFAGNDLVNFIGVPLAGFESYKLWTASSVDAEALQMSALAAQVRTPTYLLLLAGVIMSLSLWFSKKARSVTQTTLNLSRQEEGTEQFKSSYIARGLVRATTGAAKIIKRYRNDNVKHWIESRFDTSESESLKESKGLSFDLLRASVNLVVASALIAFGTSQKLPLSTTYVTFMVTMGTSLADRAWGRESAVYRITGVMIVITGWFLTAITAFAGSFLIALFINWAGLTGIIIIMVLILAVLFSSYKSHRNKVKKAEDEKEEVEATENEDTIIETTRHMLIKQLLSVSSLYDRTIIAFMKEKLKSLKTLKKEVKNFDDSAKVKKDNVHKFIRKLDDSRIDAGPFYVQIHDYLRESAHSLSYVFNPAYRHVDNNHPPLNDDQQEDLKNLSRELSEYLNFIVAILKSNSFNNIKQSFNKQTKLIDSIDTIRKKQVKRIKKGASGTKATLLYLDLVTETKNLVLQAGNILKAYRDFSNVMNR